MTHSNHWTTPPVNRTTPDWNQGTYQTTNLYPDDMYKRSKRFKKDDQEVEGMQQEDLRDIGNKEMLFNNGWYKMSSLYWVHPSFEEPYTMEGALEKNREMTSQGDDQYEGSLLYWRDKYCEKSDELERLRVQLKNEQGEIQTLKKTLFEYEGELEALREELSDSKKAHFKTNVVRELSYEETEGLLNERDKLHQQIKELQNRNHYLQVELDNYKIIFNENKDLEESVDRVRDIFERSLANASQDDLRAFQDVLDTHAADRVMEDTEDNIEPFSRSTERTTNTFGEYPLTDEEENRAFSPFSDPSRTLEAVRMQYEHSKKMCGQMEKLMQECESFLDQVDPEWILRPDSSFPLDDEQSYLDLAEENEDSDSKHIDDLIDEVSWLNENLISPDELAELLPQMDYFSTPYDKGSKDDLLDRISHLSVMYQRFGYGARGYEWRKGYSNGITDEKEKVKEQPSDELKEATSDLLGHILKQDLKRRNTEDSLEKQKIYTHEMYHANLRLQRKLDKAREFLSSWEDGDRSLDNEGTLYDTFNDFLEGKYDPKEGKWND